MQTKMLALAIAIVGLPAAAAAQQSSVVQGFECRGDDASWRLDANRLAAAYNANTPRGKREVIFRGMLQSVPGGAGATIVWRGDSTHLPRETLVAALREEACGVAVAAGSPAAHRAIVSVKSGETLSGCCIVRAGYDARLAPLSDAATKPADDWARFAPDMIPAINLCVASDGGRAKWIAKAWPMNHGNALVRMVETSGRAVDCVAAMTGRGTPRIDPLGPGDPPLPGAGNPLFYPAREQPPIVACGRLERVQGARGTLAGYLHYDPC